ncbi:MAG TPA: sulfatase, partial [Candidatus Binatia bacterium]|nr:sulfatase [Candidatus Binatia bacterium]
PMSKLETVALSHGNGKTLRLILETRGRGLGAWVDPCLLQRRDRPRTVLMLMLDTLRADHVSAYGYRRRTTPAFDALAKDSLLFSRAVSTSSWTLPAHVSLFSGRDVLGHGVVAPESVIPADLPLLAEKMQADGFVTLALTGGGFVDDRFGFSRGFQSYANRSGDIFQQKASALLYRAFMERAADYAGQDLFVFLHTYQMHAPYKAPEPYFRAFDPGLDAKIKHVRGDLRRTPGSSPALTAAESAERQKLIDLYDASVLYSDQELLKPVLAYLRDSGRFDDAMLVVLSDHGEEFFDHGDWEHGHTLYQELTRIPLLIKLPRQKSGEVRPQLVAISDIAAFIQAQYGLNRDAGNPLDRGRHDPQRVLELSLPVIPVRQGLPASVSYVGMDHQFIHNFVQPATAASAGRSADEWFSLAETPFSAVTAFVPTPALHSKYKKMLAAYLRRLKELKNSGGPLDAELLKKLKALGYLNN